MSSVDDRIVSMKFDNESFERKLGDTIKSLDKLRQSLDFSNSNKGLDTFTHSLAPVGTAVEGISGKVLAMSTIAITALATITTKAIEAGAQFSKAFSIAPIIDGFHEYETQLNAVQTILANTASKGTTIDQVNEALQKLNVYSDQTIYNFGQMARNIGTFTAAGVDLDTAVQSIKGIANIAAMSGSNSEQASTAMYQLSQAIAAGTVKLIDWNSVVNAGMGGEAFKSALFETGKAMGTLTDVPVAQSFTEWEDAGNSFRSSLETGWLTADVLTTTLSAFTGDMTEEMLLAKGFNEQQAQAIIKQAAVAKAAATEVKTFTQLVGTVKEAVGTGWADSFKIIIGNFEEAKELWTGVNKSIGDFITKSSDARNTMLQAWKDFGGRTALIQAFKDVLSGVASVFKPIKDAFREIFPKKTAADLIRMTGSFAEFAKKLKIGAETSDKIKRAFSGFFSILEIGFEVIKGVAGLIGGLISKLAPAASGLLNFSATTGDALTRLNKALVEGGGIKRFFERIGDFIEKPIELIGKFKDALSDLFNTDSGGESKPEGDLNRFQQRLEEVTSLPDKLSDAWDRFKERFSGIFDVFDKVGDYIKNWFSQLGQNIADAFGPGSFDQAVDLVNVGLLGGIALILKKFLSGGINLDFGQGLIDKISKTFEGLTGTLKAMQTQIKADALLKIGEAIALIALSLAILSLIDSAALTKALTALTVGFGELIGAMTLLDRIDFGTSIIKLDGLAAGMILLSISALILSFAVRSMSKLNWDDLTRGMVGVGVGLALMVAAMVGLTYAGPGSIIAAAGMIELSIGLTALYVAVKLFSTLGWAELAKGLAGIGGGLLILTAAMSEMPASSVLTGFGLIEFSIGLIILYKAVQLFSTLGWAELGKGLAGIGAMLLLIGAAMQEMPITMPITAAGLVILSVALTIMAEAVKLMGSLDLGTLAKGIGAFTVMLLVLSAATEAMSGTAAGALSLLVVSFALTILANVLEKIGNLSIAQIVTGLLAIAATLAILGISAAIMQPLIPALLGLGVALSLIGASFALVGAGAFLLAKAFETMAKAGVAGAQAMVDSIKILVTAIPDILRAIFTGILNFAEDLLNSMPLLIKLMTTVLDALLDAIIQLTPKIAKALGEIITEGLKLIREKAPEYVETGLTVLLAILKGIRDNISEITTVVVEIITNFINGLSEKIEPLIDAVYNLMLSVAEGVARKTGELTTAFIPIGLAFFDGLMTGLKNGVGQIFDFFTELPGRILDIIKTALGISSPSTKFMEIGANIIAGLLQGLTDAITGIFTFFTELPGKIIGWMGDILGKMIPVGADFIIGILKGIAQKELDIINWFTELPGKIIGWIGDVTGRLKQVGIDFIVGLISGFTEKIWDLFNWLIGLPALIVSYIPNPLNILKQVGEKIIDGLVDGIGGSLYKVAKKVQEIEPIIHGNKGPPAHDAVMLVHAGQLIMQGLLNGLQSGMKPIKKWLGNVNLGDHLNTNISDANVDGISSVLKKMVDELSDISEFNPIITPVLDLTKVQNDSQKLERMMRLSSISIGTSIDQARIISKTNEIDKPAEPQIQPVSSEVKFEQNIYSPTTLSAIDIYRGTKSQIAIAKEELNI